MSVNIIQNWKLCYSDSPDGKKSEMFAAKVPGCVQNDMAENMNIPKVYTGSHTEEYLWMEDKYWHYSATAQIDANGCTPVLVFTSVEYECDILINQKLILHNIGMFTPIKIDCSEYKGQTVEIETIVYPAPKRPDVVAASGLGNEASASYKPAFSYGWDWSPRFVTLGICGEVYIDYLKPAHFENVDINYTLNKDFSKAFVCIDYVLAQDAVVDVYFGEKGGNFEKLCTAMGGKCKFEIDNPKLWWPHTHGSQPIYTIELNAVLNGEACDQYKKNISFKKAKLVMNEGEWSRQKTDIQTANLAPMALEINGKRIFAKGSNFVPPEFSVSMLNYKSIFDMLKLIADANMNIIRIWGGGYIYPDYFYDCCDELGIMVWQEFQLACACYPEDEEYLAVVKKESESIIKRLKNHGCLTLWCGGNELFNSWSRMTPQAKVLRLLNAQCLNYDPETPFIESSPQPGVAHGAYDIVCPNSKRELLTLFCESNFTAYCEFGCGAPSEYDYLRTFMTAEQADNPKKDKIWRERHASGCCSMESRWLDIEYIKKLTDCSDDGKVIIEYGNLLQAELYRDMFEEVRRHRPYCSMAINWCWNEPWPTAAGNGLVNYPCVPRPSYYTVKNALRNLALSLQFTRVSWKPDEEITVTPWLLNDSFQKFCGDTVEITAKDGERVILREKWNIPKGEENSNICGNAITFKHGCKSGEQIKLKITSEKYPEISSEYILFISREAV